jgi:hypothetical protein
MIIIQVQSLLWLVTDRLVSMGMEDRRLQSVLYSVAVDASGNIYFSEDSYQRIRIVKRSTGGLPKMDYLGRLFTG